MSIKFIVLASPRSGSTRLMSCLNQHSELNVYQEPLNIDYRGLDLSIFDFNIYPCEVLPDEIHDKICQGKYIDMALKKYNGIKILTVHMKNDVPDILHKYPIIQLIRKNKLAWYTSLEVAKKTNLWVHYKEYLDTIPLDPIECEKYINYFNQQELLYIKKYNPCVVYYENDIQDTCDTICKYLNIKPFNVVSTTKKRIKRPLNEVITNYYEVQNFDHEI